MLQSALYAAERMSHAIWISHTVNLVIIGELFTAVSHIGSHPPSVDDVAYVWWYLTSRTLFSRFLTNFTGPNYAFHS